MIEQQVADTQHALDQMARCVRPDDLLRRWWQEFSGAVRGWVEGSTTVSDLNMMLRERVLERVELDTLPNGHIVIRPVQKVTGEVLRTIQVADSVPVLMPDGSLNRVRPLMRVPGASGADVYLWPFHPEDDRTERMLRAREEAGLPPVDFLRDGWEPWHWGNLRGC